MNCVIRLLLPRLADTAVVPRDARTGRDPWRLGLPLFLAAVTLAAFVNALAVAARLGQTSDSAYGLVVGAAIAGGNVLLSGWHFPLDDYYFTDAVPYAFVESIFGSQPFLLVLVPAITYAMFVLAALLAVVKRERSSAENLQGVAAIALLLAAPSWIGQWDPVLMSDMHMTTVLGAFVALVLCARIAGESDTRSIVADTVLIIITCTVTASDPFALVFAFGPALAILAGDTVLRRGSQGSRLALSLLMAGAAAGLILPWAIARSGGFTTENDILTRPQTLALLPRNLIAVATGTFTLFGANPFAAGNGFRDIVVLCLRAAGLLLAVGALWRMLRYFFSPACIDLLDRTLCAGIVAVLVACAASAQFAKGIAPQTLWTGGPPIRFLVPAWLFAAVLAGRQTPELLSALRGARIRRAVSEALVFAATIIALGGFWLSRLASHPVWIADNPPAMAANWLRRHGVWQGVGEYWSANLVTAMSGNMVQVRSVVPVAGRLADYVWVEDTRWYTRTPQFVIWQDNNKTNVTADDVRATYPGVRITTVADYRIALISARR